MENWLLTDPHFFHLKLVTKGYRPAGYEDLIRSSWLSLVLPSDVVYCLGDVCHSRQAEAHEQYVRPMPGRKILVRGNHDKQRDEWYLSHGWDEVHDAVTVWVNGRPVLLSHIPQPDNGKFSINVHGHFHNDLHRASEPEMVAIRCHKHRLLALECVNYKLVKLEDFVEGKIEQPGLPIAQ